MNPRVQKLVDALRSGEYTQTTSRLCRVGSADKDSYCCLGVACEIYQKEVGDLNSHIENDCRVYGYTDSVLPEQVRLWFGFTTSVGHFEDAPEVGNSLAFLNDSGASFEKIASVIESNPPRLFLTENES